MSMRNFINFVKKGIKFLLWILIDTYMFLLSVVIKSFTSSYNRLKLFYRNDYIHNQLNTIKVTKHS